MVPNRATHHIFSDNSCCQTMVSWSSGKKSAFFGNVYFVWRTFFNFCFISMYCVSNKFSEYVYIQNIYTLLHIIKKHFMRFFACLFFKSLKPFSVSLRQFYMNFQLSVKTKIQQGISKSKFIGNQQFQWKQKFQVIKAKGFIFMQ